MSEAMSDFLERFDRESERKWQQLDRIVAAADTARVFGAPVTSGQYVVITAAEVAAGGGFGSGMGFGGPRRPRRGEGEEAAAGQAAAATFGDKTFEPMGTGGGGGGGGGSMGRPVAAIVIGPDGVVVKPVFDITKMALAGITAWGAVAGLGIKMASKRRKLARGG